MVIKTAPDPIQAFFADPGLELLLLLLVLQLNQNNYGRQAIHPIMTESTSVGANCCATMLKPVTYPQTPTKPMSCEACGRHGVLLASVQLRLEAGKNHQAIGSMPRQ